MNWISTKIKNEKNWQFCLLAIIIIFASFLRLYQLGLVPNGFQGDEAAYGYNAYSLLTTGTDEYGKHFPLVLKSFEDYKPALYAYLDIPFISILGLNELAVRLPSALFGIFSVIAIYFLTKKIISNSVIGLISAFLLSISPWHINLSRTTSEVVVSLFFLLIMIYGFATLKEKFSKFWCIITILSGSLSLGFYTASRFFVLITLILFIVFSIQKVKNRFHIEKGLVIVGICLLLFEILYNGAASNKRFDQVSIFSSTQTTLTLEEQIREDQFTNPFQTRFFHNKIINYTRTILENYSQYFTLDFLALNGGYPKRERIPDTGVFYLWQIPFLLIGLYFIFKKNIQGGIFLFVLWLLLIIPASITFDDIPNVYRTLVIVPPMLIIIAIGIYYLFQLLKNKKIFLLIIFSLVLISSGEFLYYQHEYFIHQNIHQPWYRNYPMKELSLSLKKYYPHFSTILLTKEQNMSYIHILFFQKINPLIYQKSGSHLDTTGTGFKKYLFTYKKCPFVISKDPNYPKPDPTILYVDSGSCKIQHRDDVRVLKTIYWGDHTPAFVLIQYVPENLRY